MRGSRGPRLPLFCLQELDACPQGLSQGFGGGKDLRVHGVGQTHGGDPQGTSVIPVAPAPEHEQIL